MYIKASFPKISYYFIPYEGHNHHFCQKYIGVYKLLGHTVGVELFCVIRFHYHTIVGENNGRSDERSVNFS